jgi:hypothetical protein
MNGRSLSCGGMFGAGLGDDLESDGVDAVDPRGGVQDLDCDQAVIGIVVEDHARFLLADPRRSVAQHHGQGVGRAVVLWDQMSARIARTSGTERSRVVRPSGWR